MKRPVIETLARPLLIHESKSTQCQTRLLQSVIVDFYNNTACQLYVGTSGLCPTKSVILHSPQTPQKGLHTVTWNPPYPAYESAWFYICTAHTWESGVRHQMTDFAKDYLSLWCLIPRRGLAVCLIWRQIDGVKICYVCNDHSAICEGMPMILSNNPFIQNPCPQSSLPSGLHGYGAQQSDWMASPPRPTLPHPVSNSAPCQTEQLPLGWVIVQKGGGNAGPREVKAWARKKWLKQNERDRLWIFI